MLEDIMTDAMFEMPSKKHNGKLAITLDYARKKLGHNKLVGCKN